jgi:AraC-like DNA-binding protein
MYIHTYPCHDDALLDRDSLPRTGDNYVYLPVLLQTGSNIPIRQTFEEIVYLSFSKSHLQKLRARLLLSMLVVELAQFSADSWSMVGGQIEYVRNLIERNPHKNYSIDQLAEKVGLNRRTLTRNFRKKTGKSIKQHEIESKIGISMHIFRTKPTLTIKEVAYQLGFYDEFYFSHMFHRVVGVAPSAYKLERLSTYDSFSTENEL